MFKKTKIDSKELKIIVKNFVQKKKQKQVHRKYNTVSEKQRKTIIVTKYITLY